MAKKKHEWAGPVSDEVKILLLASLDEEEQALTAAASTLKARQREYDVAVIHRDAIAGAVEIARARGLLDSDITTEEITS